MAPEQALGRGDLDGRSDLYAVGVIGYHMLCGQPPFQDDNPMAVMIAHAHQEVPPISSHRSDIPVDLQQVVERCLAKSPANRYGDALELERALVACAAASDWDSRSAAIWWHDRCSAPAGGKTEVETTKQFIG
jgi:serine/threonine-protein kinase